MPVKLPILLLMVLALASCNSPPLYESRAKEFLEKRDVTPDLILRLQTRSTLSEAEVNMLSTYRSIPVLHLLANNPATPLRILQGLSKHKNYEVITGLVSNPATPLETVLSFRTPGEYTTVNLAISSNPKLPLKIFQEMFQAGEIGYSSPALNPRCPPEILWKIYQRDEPFARMFLLANPHLPAELRDRLTRNHGPSGHAR